MIGLGKVGHLQMIFHSQHFKRLCLLLKGTDYLTNDQKIRSNTCGKFYNITPGEQLSGEYVFSHISHLREEKTDVQNGTFSLVFSDI